MKRYVLTGAPGCGKTAIIRMLETRGHAVVEEAATDVIALQQAQGVDDGWTDPAFIDAITDLQIRRQARATGEVQFHDRSVVCTHALATFLGHPVPPALTAEIERVRRERVFQTKVFFVQNLGFITPTAARRISFEDSLKFEAVHAETYARFGYDCVPIAPAPPAERVKTVLTLAAVRA